MNSISLFLEAVRQVGWVTTSSVQQNMKFANNLDSIEETLSLCQRRDAGRMAENMAADVSATTLSHRRLCHRTVL